MTRDRTESLAMLAVAASGLAWGIFWIPLRMMTDQGIEGAWATVLFYVVPMVLLLPLYLWRWRPLARGGWALNVGGLLAGLALVLYAGALIFTDVVQALLLFYLTPLWSTLLARLVLKEAISPLRWMTMALAFLGLLVIFKVESGLPQPRNAGDWMGLAAGFVWAVAAVRIRGDDSNHGIDFTLVYFAWGSVAALALALLPWPAGHGVPSGGLPAQGVPTWDAITTVLPWLVPVAIVLVIPPSLAVLWGASLLSPGIVSILFMTEISAGAVTAAIWADEPFGPREILGIALITTAGLLEPLRELAGVRQPWRKSGTLPSDS